MIKMIGLLKRKPGMTREAFREYYETQHRLIGEKYLKGYASKYMRRYLEPRPERGTGNLIEPDFDVILEIWYPDAKTLEESNRRLASPDIAAEIAVDEEKLFDLTHMHFYFLDEAVSDI